MSKTQFINLIILSLMESLENHKAFRHLSYDRELAGKYQVSFRQLKKLAKKYFLDSI